MIQRTAWPNKTKLPQNRSVLIDSVEESPEDLVEAIPEMITANHLKACAVTLEPSTVDVRKILKHSKLMFLDSRIPGVDVIEMRKTIDISGNVNAPSELGPGLALLDQLVVEFGGQAIRDRR